MGAYIGLTFGLAMALTLAIVLVFGRHQHTADHHGTEFHVQAVDHWTAPDAPAARRNPVRDDAASRERGWLLFDWYCMSCHGRDGMGDGEAVARLGFPAADLTRMTPQHPDGDLAWKIAEGRDPMPGWKDRLSETDIWHLVNYLRVLERRERTIEDSSSWRE